jgi:hypothetical protein
MLTLLLRALLHLNADVPVEQADDWAHLACERAVYDTLAPLTPDDATNPLAEAVATALCRNEGFGPDEEWVCPVIGW